MEVILREHIDNLGRRGDVVKVARRLRAQLPVAAQAGAGRHRLEQAADRSREEGRRGQARRKRRRRPRRWPQRLEAVEIEIARRVGENNTLYGSVTSADIAQALEAKGFQVDKRKITLAEPLKAIGEVTVPLKIHRDVTANLKVKVVPGSALTKLARRRTARAGQFSRDRKSRIGWRVLSSRHPIFLSNGPHAQCLTSLPRPSGRYRTASMPRNRCSARS